MKPHVTARRMHGTPYTEYSIWLGDTLIHCQISPYSEGEIADRVRSHLHPPPVPVARPFNWNPSKKPGPKPGKKSSGWRDDDLDPEAA